MEQNRMSGQSACSPLSRRSILTGALAALGALGAAPSKAIGDSRAPVWPSFIYEDLQHVALSIYVTGALAANRTGDSIVDGANQFLNDRLRQLSIDSVSYADLLQQAGSAIDLKTLVIFCKVHLRSWPLSGEAANLVIGGVTLVLQRAARQWQNQFEHVGLFASPSDEHALSDAILKAVKAHLDQALVTPLIFLVK
jgi:hypothetical protein